MFLSHLECTACKKQHDWRQLQNLCTACGKPLFAIYDLAAIRKSRSDGFLAVEGSVTAGKPSFLEKTLWRWREMLPLPMDIEPVSLGEGGTPLLEAKQFGADTGVELWIKDESV